VLEVQAVAGPDLDDAAAEPEEELGAVGALAGGLGLRAQTVKRLARRRDWLTAALTGARR